MELWRATQSLENTADWQRARQLQVKASLAEAELFKGGVSSILRPDILREPSNCADISSRCLD